MYCLSFVFVNKKSGSQLVDFSVALICFMIFYFQFIQKGLLKLSLNYQLYIYVCVCVAPIIKSVIGISHHYQLFLADVTNIVKMHQ